MSETLPVVASPPQWPILGALLDFRKAPLQFLVDNRVRHGDWVRYKFGPASIIQANHPDIIDEVLLHKQMIKDDVTRRLKSLLGNGLVTSEGDFWRRQRKLAAPAFQRKHIDAYASTMVARTNALCEPIRDEVRDIHHDMMGVTHEIVLQTLLGTRLEADQEGVAKGIEIYMEEFQSESNGWRRVLPDWLWTPGRGRMWRAIAAIDKSVAATIADRKSNPDGNDVLSRLLAARDDDGQPMSPQQLRDEAVTFFTAGHETTGLALTYTIHLLVDHPDVLARLVEEIDGLAGAELTAADEARLPYTRAVFQESMRVLPPVWAIGREAIADCEVSGRPVFKHDQFFLSQWVVHRDPRFFADPEDFRPERWLDGLEKRLPRCAYFPFGGGPRVCIGNHFAMLEGILILATLLQRVRVEKVAQPPLVTLPTVTLRPAGPVRVRMVRRAEA